MTIQIRHLSSSDKAKWESVWQKSVGGVLEKTVVNHTYRQILDGHIHALIACDDSDRLVGLLHYVVHPVAGCIAPVCYMQDLYVVETHRRQGVARLLVENLKTVAEDKKFDRIYWLLENENKVATEFYKNLGVSLDFGLYMIPIIMKERLNLP
jgi:GNAT superfamily N-acetyltransferase